MKILIADDDASMRTMLRTQLSRWGHEVLEATDGAEALPLLESEKGIQAAILDWQMPGMDGLEVCRRLHQQENAPYVLLVTGKGTDREVIQGLEAGANDYLTKPFTPDTLRIRMLVAARFVEMRGRLIDRVVELEGGIAEKNEVDRLLADMINSRQGVSDLLFINKKFPQVEAFGKLKAAPIPGWNEVLTPERIKKLTTFFMNGDSRLHSDFESMGSCDCSYAIEDAARFRVNIYRQNGVPAIVMRKLESEVPSLEKLNLPPIFQDIIKEKNGIVFVTGSTGSGKTTTLAAMLNELNLTSEVHVVTLEDPIEFLHPPLKATFSQRQLGQDFYRFSDGLRAALRQAPKVILVGEIRDRETMEIAMTASETGHLVFSTLHTVNAGQSIHRILGMFAKEEESQIRQRLSETLRYIVSQRLVPKVSGGRLLVTEIMGSSLRTREAVCYGESEGRTFQEIIEAGVTKGWHSFDQSLLDAYDTGLITEETTLLYCNSKSNMGHRINRSKQLRGIDMTSTSGMRLEQPTAPVEAAVVGK
ncbi:MAG: PilT/PilU family type 4a pilus ATPase [Verrucomicrobiota bacterium]